MTGGRSRDNGTETLYFGTEDGSVYCVNSVTGEEHVISPESFSAIKAHISID